MAKKTQLKSWTVTLEKTETITSTVEVTVKAADEDEAMERALALEKDGKVPPKDWEEYDSDGGNVEAIEAIEEE